MPRYMVAGKRRGMQVTWIADHARDEADAVEQFHLANARCDPNPVASQIGDIPGVPDLPDPEPAVEDCSPPEAAAVVSSRAEQPAPAGSPPAKKATPAAEGIKRGPAAELPDAASPEPDADIEVGVLEAYGVKPNDIAELYAAGLRTLSAIEAFDAEHGGLTNVHGIGPVGEQQIREGIAAWRQTSKI